MCQSNGENVWNECSRSCNHVFQGMKSKNKLEEMLLVHRVITYRTRLDIFFLQTLHNQLLLHYDCKPERVEEGICQLIDVLENNTKPHKLDQPPRKEDIVRHIPMNALKDG